MNKFFKRIVWLFIATPIVYLLLIWEKLPERVAMHFDMKGNPDRFGNKKELLGVALLMIVISAGVYLLLTNINRIDPKRYAKDMQDKYDKIAVTTVVFLSGIHFLIIDSALRSQVNFSSGVIFALISVLFAVLGNYMHTLKPNYFVGIRVPWTLENEDNWRKTHQLASRVWFISGIIMAILTLILPPAAGMIVFFTGIAIITIIPVVYSYQLFVKMKNKK